MKMKIEITAKYDFNIEVNSSILDEVARRHNGNFDAWVKENYDDHFCSSDLDIEIESISYNKEEAKKLLEKAREVIGSSDEDLCRTSIDREKLRFSIMEQFRDTPVETNALCEVNVDIDLLYKILPFVDIHNPKFELNYIHLRENIVEATDTRAAIKIQGHKYSFTDICFPTYFLEPLKNGGKVFLNKDNQLFLHYENSYYKGVDETYSKPVFPDIDRITTKDIESSNISKIRLDELVTNIVTLDDFQEAVEILFFEKKYYIHKTYYDKAMKFNLEYIASYSNEKSIYPFFFFDANTQIIIMPIFPDKFTKIEKKS